MVSRISPDLATETVDAPAVRVVPPGSPFSADSAPSAVQASPSALTRPPRAGSMRQRKERGKKSVSLPGIPEVRAPRRGRPPRRRGQTALYRLCHATEGLIGVCPQKRKPTQSGGVYAAHVREYDDFVFVIGQ